jgi:hypothetical protein
MKLFTLLAVFMLSNVVLAEIKWTDYSEEAFSASIQGGKKVVLAFHKKGCGGCKAQEVALEKSESSKNPNVVFYKVQRTDDAHTPIYERYGFKNKNTWAALVLVDKNGEIARVKPGNFKEEDVLAFSTKAN